MSAIEIKFPALYPKQHAAFFNDARVSVCEATTKAGKSVGGLTWQAWRAINVNPGSARLWVEPTFPLAKRMFERMERIYSRMDPSRDLGWDLNRSELYFVHPGGSRQYFKGSDRPDLIYGTDAEDAVIDEGSRCKEEAFFAVRSVLTATRGPLRIIGNVKGRKNWQYRLARRAEAGTDPGLQYHKITADDAVEAGVLDREEIEQARALLPDHVFRELYMAEASDDSGCPFQGIRDCIIPRLSDLPPVVWGWDVARDVDFTAGIALDCNGDVCRFEHWQRPWDETIDQIARTNCANIVDETGLGKPVVELIQRRHGNTKGVIFSQQSKQAMMQSLAVAIKSRQIRFPDGMIANELESFEYEYREHGIRYSAPEGMHDDCVCALALAVSGFQFGYRPVSEDALEVIEREDWLAPWA